MLRQTPFTYRIRSRVTERGTTMIEVLVTILIIAIGLLGMAGLQARSHGLEFESYQRGQALILLQDMVDRMNNNAAGASGYATTGVGTGATDNANCTSLTTRAAVDLCEWSKALKGGGEFSGTTRQGAMMDGRGCVALLTTNTYLVSVVWQGMSSTVPPVSDCGEGEYTSESTRRAVTAVVLVPDLGAS